MNTIYLNHHFRFVLTYYDHNGKRQRHFVGAGQLSEYLGEKNAETVQKCANAMKRDKHTVKFRKCGQIDIYSK
ncbi:hypothetical protein I6H88_03170 [Elizabethkingia bruuniana]|uniref:Uncharacterized protein n=1 Tax=Elizabethkingia bruuniana TaxID=1756149 RepID=A0A7T7V0H0_9FLAO|nr:MULTISPECIES: hypothetical protein [Elizabethkingia]QDZ61773.1 hypothetical protein EVD20_00885 [Elizabethkingia bruuniana]QQN59596.1 hypothetical protein I6H88_03170 [Elizabethkingia bruuniana]UTF99475.1 hypothetical protein J2O04_14575 [Elizabethkingia anophelis]